MKSYYIEGGYVAKSFRLNPELALRLEQAARMEGLPVSAFIREAIGRRCDEVLSANLRDGLADVIGMVHGGGGMADRTGDAFTAMVVAKAKKQGLLAGGKDKIEVSR